GKRASRWKFLVPASASSGREILVLVPAGPSPAPSAGTISSRPPAGSSRPAGRSTCLSTVPLPRRTPMLLSRIRLSPEAVYTGALGEIPADPYRLHRAVWDLFADHPDRRRDFLYRIDWDGGRPTLMTLSDRPPEPAPGLWQAEIKELRPILRQ